MFFTDTTKASLKWEYDYKRSEEERETMEMSIEKLRSDLGKSEHKNKQLLDQVRYSLPDLFLLPSQYFIGNYGLVYSFVF